MSDTAVRASCVDGLRQLADFIEAHPDFPVPLASASVYLWGEDAKERLGAVARILGTAVKEADSLCIGVARSFGSVTLRVRAERTNVCERVVVGTKTETYQVAPEGVELEERERTVEIVEWVCPPSLLALAEGVA